jgi:hypothetical protein
MSMIAVPVHGIGSIAPAVPSPFRVAALIQRLVNSPSKTFLSYDAGNFTSDASAGSKL